MDLSAYNWLTFNDDGTYAIDMASTTPAEMDRRLIIAQELSSGHLVPSTPAVTGETLLEIVKRELCARGYEEVESYGGDVWTHPDWDGTDKILMAVQDAFEKGR